MSYVIDRRLNGKNKSTVNRQRFLRRYRDHIKKAVEEIFNVKVASVRTINYEGKEKRRGRQVGRRPNWKKAYVTLKKGEPMVDYAEAI